MLHDWWERYQHFWQGQTRSQRWQWIGVVVATMLGAAYRLYNLRDSMWFLADQGRDAIIAYNILQGDFTLVGPSTSVGDMFLGPLYYYFMVPWLWLWGLDPVGPALGVAIVSILTIPLLYIVGRHLVGGVAALLATMLYSFGPMVVTYSRFSWNPNPMPFISLLILYSVWRAWRGSAWWWTAAVLGWCVIIQLHYVALLMAAPIGIFWLADMVRTATLSGRYKSWRQHLLALLASVVVFLLSIVPLLIFNWRFEGIIWQGFSSFFHGGGNEAAVPVSTKLWAVFKEQEGRSMQVLFELWGAKDWFSWYRELNQWLLRGYILLLGMGIWRRRHDRSIFGYSLLLVTALTSILGLAFYRGTVHHHYVTYFYPISYLLAGMVLVEVARWFKTLGVVLATIFFIYISWLQVTPQSLEYLDTAGWPISKMEQVSQRVLEELPEDKTYLFAALTEVRDYRGLNYRYFLEISNHPPVPMEKFGQADLLAIVAENPTQPEEVLQSPVHEIATFPVGEYRRYEHVAGGPTIYIVERREE